MSAKTLYALTIVGVAAATAGATALLFNVRDRKQEARQTHLELAALTEDTIEPAEWGKNFPREYDGFKRTVDTQRTRYGGSEAFSKLDRDPRLKRIFAGYAFSLDYREERGHATRSRTRTRLNARSASPSPEAACTVIRPSSTSIESWVAVTS